MMKFSGGYLFFGSEGRSSIHGEIFQPSSPVDFTLVLPVLSVSQILQIADLLYNGLDTSWANKR